MFGLPAATCGVTGLLIPHEHLGWDMSRGYQGESWRLRIHVHSCWVRPLAEPSAMFMGASLVQVANALH